MILLQQWISLPDHQDRRVTCWRSAGRRRQRRQTRCCSAPQTISRVSTIISASTMRRVLLSAILAIVCLVPHLAAQSKTGTLMGRVQDQQKAFIPGAEVTLTNTKTKETYKTSSNDMGEYTIQVPRGTYMVTVKLPGFPRVFMRDVKVKEGKSTKLAPTTLSAPASGFYPLEPLPEFIPIPLAPVAPPSSNRL